jgi:hypothetical protein
MLAWERQRRLQEKYSYLLELEKVKNFSWDDWRKRVSMLIIEDVFHIDLGGRGHMGDLKAQVVA